MVDFFKRCYVFICILFLLLVLYFYYMLIPVSAFADAEDCYLNDDINFDPCDNNSSSFCYLTANEKYVLHTNKCIIEGKIYSNSVLKTVKTIASNFVYFDYDISRHNVVLFKIECLEESDDYHAEIEFRLEDNTSFVSNLYVVCNEKGVFYSDFSKDAAYNEYQVYLRNNKNNETISKDINTEIRLRNGVAVTPEDNSAIESTLPSVRGINDTYASGVITWYDDDGYPHPVRNAKLQLFDGNSVGSDTWLGTTYSNSSGHYSITFRNDDTIFDNGSDIYLVAWASNDNITVKNSNSSLYYKTSDTHVDVETGSTTQINIDFFMSEDAGKAMQILQAVDVARTFAETMMGRTPPSVDVVYPFLNASRPERGCYYDNDQKTIYITGRPRENVNCPHSYASWDAIMHEYGHHLQYALNIIDYGGVWHYFDRNLIGEEKQNGAIATKDEAIRTAYPEAWATAFAIIAQNECPYYICNIPTVSDYEYFSYNNAYFELETGQDHTGVCIRKGDACEGSILAVLWDIYDGTPNETNDSISMSALDWWNITTISGTYTFSSFAQHFYNEYPDYKHDLGANLSYYKICASEFAVGETSSPSEPIPISWSNDSGWDDHPFATAIYAISEDEGDAMLIAYGDTAECSGVINQSQWNTILNWSGRTFKIKLFSAQEGPPITGTYESQLYVIQKPLFTVVETGDTFEITGTYVSLVGSVSIPSVYHGKIVTSIANNAFSGQTGITYVHIPNTITSIGSGAFSECTSLDCVSIDSLSQLTRIENYTFYRCPISTLYWQNYNIEYIGDYAFYGSSLQRIILTNNTTYVGTYAFGNNNNLTIYCESDGAGWHSSWNPSNRPFIGYCFLSSNYSYVESFIKSGTNPGTAYSGTINNPIRSDYTFDGWYTTSNYSGTRYSTIDSAPNGMLYVKWYKPSSSSCIAEGSLITLADGTQTAVENLTGNEELLVWDMLNGTFTSAPVLFIDTETTTTYDVITLTFSDCTTVEVIDEHAFFDVTLNKYVFLRNDATQYIGHYFKKQSYGINNNMTLENVQLIDVSISQQETTPYSPVTYGHLCYYVNGMLSMPGNTESFINIFDVNPTTMAYDGTGMAQDIATYGLYTYEEFNNIIPIPQLVFDAFNGQYLKVAIGKGITTLEEIQNLLNRYTSFFE